VIVVENHFESTLLVGIIFLYVRTFVNNTTQWRLTNIGDREKVREKGKEKGKR
jgi:hypothetical protein